MKKILLFNTALMLFFAASAQTLQEGIIQTEALKYAQAKQTFITLIQQQPSNADLNYYLADVYLLANEEEQAEKTLNEGMAKNHENALCIVGQGKLQIAKKNLEQAKIEFAKAVVLTKNKNAKVLLYIGEALTNGEVKDLAQAEIYLTRALELDANDPNINLAIGDLWLERKDASKPIENYKIALQKDNKCLKAYLRKGRLYASARTQESYLVAVSTIQEGLKIDSTYAPFYSEMAYLNNLAKNYEKAKINYEKYLAIVGDDIYARVKYAGFLFLTKEYQKAVDEINSIHTQDSSRPYLYRLMGYSHYELGITYTKPGDSTQAKDEFKKGLYELDKFFAKQTNAEKIITDDYKYYGLLLIKLGKDSLGCNYLKKAVEKINAKASKEESKKEYELEREKLPEIYSVLAENYLRNKKYIEAINALNSKLVIKQSANDYFSLGRADVYAAKNDSTRQDSAIAAFSKVIELKPDNPLGYYWLARTKSDKDPKVKIGDAKPLYEKFLEIIDSDTLKYKKESYKKEIVEANRFIGFYHFYLGKKEDAIPFFKKVLAIDPKDVSSQDAKIRLKF